MKLVLEITGSTVKKYIRGLTLAGCVTGSTKSYYQYDAHGNVVQLTNASGAVTQSYDYDAFGNQFAPSLTDSNLFRYSGEYFDEETELYYLRARQYSPAIGRFTQEDTYRGEYASPLSLNLYSYCHNDPIQYVDPSGNIPLDTVFDIISLSFSIVDWLFDPSKENLIAAAIDAAALMMPYVTAAMMGTAAAIALKRIYDTPATEIIDNAGGFSKAVDNLAVDIKKATDDLLSDTAKAGNATENATKATKNIPKKKTPLSWGNPKSTLTYGHTFLNHGQKKTAQQLIGRANGFENPHQVGQWLDDKQAADFLANIAKGGSGVTDIKLPLNIKARVFLPDGTEVIPDRVMIVWMGNGSIRTAYPYSSLYPVN